MKESNKQTIDIGDFMSCFMRQAHSQSPKELMSRKLENFKYMDYDGVWHRKSKNSNYTQREMRLAFIYSRLSPLDFYHTPTETCNKEKVKSMIEDMPKKIPTNLPRMLSANLFAHYIYETGLMPYFYRHKAELVRYSDIVSWIYEKRDNERVPKKKCLTPIVKQVV